MSLFRFLRRRAVRAMLRGAHAFLFGKQGQRRVHGLRLFNRLRTEVLLRTDEPVGKLARRAEVRLWVDGNDAFRRIEKLLRRARFSIVIQMYIWMDDETGRSIAAFLVEAADRGVTIDITKEATGDVFELEGDFLTTKGSKDDIWKRFWSHPRIHVTYSKREDHTKAFVIDGDTLLLTGMNIADVYRHHWHDYLVELRGAQFVQHYLTGSKVPHPEKSVQLFMNTGEHKEMRSAVRSLLHSARHSVVLEQCYCSDPEVIALLAQLSHKGIRITIIVPESPDLHYHANRQAMGRLLAEGDREHVTVLLYPGIVHGKVILVDRRRALLGSANMMISSLDRMGEVNVLIDHRHRALWKLRETLRLDILKSRPLMTLPRFRIFGKWLAWVGL